MAANLKELLDQALTKDINSETYRDKVEEITSTLKYNPIKKEIQPAGQKNWEELCKILKQHPDILNIAADVNEKQDLREMIISIYVSQIKNTIKSEKTDIPDVFLPEIVDKAWDNLSDKVLKYVHMRLIKNKSDTSFLGPIGPDSQRVIGLYTEYMYLYDQVKNDHPFINPILIALEQGNIAQQATACKALGVALAHIPKNEVNIELRNRVFTHLLKTASVTDNVKDIKVKETARWTLKMLRRDLTLDENAQLEEII